MLWNRIFQGIFGFFPAFSAGEQLQLWIDEGKVCTGQKDAGLSRVCTGPNHSQGAAAIDFVPKCFVGAVDRGRSRRSVLARGSQLNQRSWCPWRVRAGSMQV